MRFRLSADFIPSVAAILALSRSVEACQHTPVYSPKILLIHKYGIFFHALSLLALGKHSPRGAINIGATPNAPSRLAINKGIVKIGSYKLLKYKR